MLSQEENDLLTRTGPDTPGGALLRRYWQPIALAEELPANGVPLPVRVMSEDLVLFRDDQGQLGLLGLHCSHRRADLSYGRVENGGLRCLYHGWLYDRHGNCLEQPCEPVTKRFCEKVHHPAYPCHEQAGIIFAYMGPGEVPLLPGYEPLLAPPSHVLVTKIFHECNYFQANEGNLDPSHVSYLHRQANVPENLKRPVEGSDGKLYGTTSYGGDFDSGILFRIEKDGTGYSILHQFNSATNDAYYPVGDLYEGPGGTLFGVTYFGGIDDSGTIYMIKRDGGGFTILHSFLDSQRAGQNPNATLVRGPDGGIYGTAVFGGTFGCGSIFRIAPIKLTVVKEISGYRVRITGTIGQRYAIERADTANIERLWDDDVLVWHSGDREDNDRPRALRVIYWFIKRTTERRYEILDRQLFDGGFVQQHILHANCRNGGSIALRVCIVIKLGANGLISRIDEYFDPAEMAPLLESTDSQRR